MWETPPIGWRAVPYRLEGRLKERVNAKQGHGLNKLNDATKRAFTSINMATKSWNQNDYLYNFFFCKFDNNHLTTFGKMKL